MKITGKWRAAGAVVVIAVVFWAAHALWKEPDSGKSAAANAEAAKPAAVKTEAEKAAEAKVAETAKAAEATKAEAAKAADAAKVETTKAGVLRAEATKAEAAAKADSSKAAEATKAADAAKAAEAAAATATARSADAAKAADSARAEADKARGNAAAICRTHGSDSERPPINSDVVVTIDMATAWQPRGGEVRFIVESSTATLTGLDIAACFRWIGIDDSAAYVRAPLRTIEPVSTTGALNRVVYGATVPQGLSSSQHGARPHSAWPARILSQIFPKWFTLVGSYDNTMIVPLAELRIVALGAMRADKRGEMIDVRRAVGITNIWTARLAAIGGVVGAVVLLGIAGGRRGVPGNGYVMRLFSTRQGYASLSQFQIVLWSFVFGAGAIYVWALSGSLINIPGSALVLLGIAGITTLGAKIQNNNEKDRQKADNAPQVPPAPQAGQQPPPAPVAAPNAVAAAPLLSNASDDGMALTWTPPAAGAAVAAYRVEYAVAGSADWELSAMAVAGPSYRVKGLQPSQAYDFRVFALNAAGVGPASPSATLSTLPASTVLRRPRWSDLVVTPNHPGEIDVTRMQMLFFTLVSAGFVTVRLIDSYSIPEVPEGFMLLMGISNSVYLSSKFANRD